jgi:DNA-binding NtrC family response regulator
MDKLLPVVVMTAWGSVDQAVAAMGRGASDLCRSPGRIGGFCSKGNVESETELKIARPIRKHKIFGQSTTNDFP